MTDYSANLLYTGLLLTAAGFFSLVRHFLLQPGIPNYPKAPRWLLRVSFLFATILMFVGTHYIAVYFNGEGNTSPPGAPSTLVLLSLGLFVNKGSMLINVLSERLPSGIWARINRTNDIIKNSFVRNK